MLSEFAEYIQEHHIGNVLILILLDHALRGNEQTADGEMFLSLNPYSIGPCSPSSINNIIVLIVLVLILILLDHALRGTR